MHEFPCHGFIEDHIFFSEQIELKFIIIAKRMEKFPTLASFFNYIYYKYIYFKVNCVKIHIFGSNAFCCYAYLQKKKKVELKLESGLCGPIIRETKSPFHASLVCTL